VSELPVKRARICFELLVDLRTPRFSITVSCDGDEICEDLKDVTDWLRVIFVKSLQQL